MLKKDEDEDSDDLFPSPDEMEVLRYYCYINHGIDTVHIAPIEQAWLDHISVLIPDKLRAQIDQLNSLTKEVEVGVGLLQSL